MDPVLDRLLELAGQPAMSANSTAPRPLGAASGLPTRRITRAAPATFGT
jgi:hypothetical protein